MNQNDILSSVTGEKMAEDQAQVIHDAYDRLMGRLRKKISKKLEYMETEVMQNLIECRGLSQGQRVNYQRAKTILKRNQKGERTGVHTPNIPTAVMQSGLTISEIAKMAEDFGVDSLTEGEKQALKASGYDISGKGPIVPKGKPGRKARANERRAKLIPQGEMSPSNPSVQRKLAEERENIEAAETGKPSPPPKKDDDNKKLLR